MSEKKHSEEGFKNLAIAMVNNAKKEIKKINEQTLFQRAELKKRYINEDNENYQKIRVNILSAFNKLLNESLSSTLLFSRKSFLNLKNSLKNELKASVFNVLLENMLNKYSKYTEFIIRKIKDITEKYNQNMEFKVIFNKRDYDYFTKNKDKVFSQNIKISNINTDLEGGFKLLYSNGKISYDYSLRNLINKNSTEIQIEISKLIDESQIKELETDFDHFIQEEKSKINQFMRDYDNI